MDEHFDDIKGMIEWTERQIADLGGKTMLRENPASTPGRKLPPILLGELSSSDTDSKDLKTVCVYGHLDVQPAAKEDGWDSEPFVLTERDGKLYGRGSTDDKGPVLSWFAAIEAFQRLDIKIPVNIKFILEGMEEYGSDGLFETIQTESKPNKFLSDVDFFCISDNYWLGKHKPCLTYGLRGLAYFQCSVQGTEQDLHSGVTGGTVPEAMTDLIKLMSTLVDSQGKILVDGVLDQVAPVTPEEEALYDAIEFDLDEYKKEIRVVGNRLINDGGGKRSLLMARWRYPTLSLHGIEGAFSGGGAKTVIPAKVIGKFSLRLVPDQDPVDIEIKMKLHLQKEFAKVSAGRCFRSHSF